MKPIILFDLDGVIADSWKGFFATSCKLMDTLGLQHLNKPEIVLKMFEGNFILNLLKAISPKVLTRDLLHQLSSDLQKVMIASTPYQGIQQALYTLATQHKLFLVTSNDTEAAKIFLKKYDLNCFEQVLGADKEPSKVKKIQTIQQQYPEHTLYYIGDTLGDLLEAEAAKAIPVAAGWGWHDRATLMKGEPAHYLYQPDDLPNYFASLTYSKP